MVRRAVVTLLCLGLLVSAQGWASAGYRDTGFDPDDRRVLGFDPDIRSTTRRVTQTDGGRILTIAVRAYEDFGLYWFEQVRLDSRGGPKIDYRMFIANQDQSGAGCSVYRPGHVDDAVGGRFTQVADRAVCRVPARLVRPTKEIRWKLFSPSGYVHTNREYAPDDRGWYS